MESAGESPIVLLCPDCGGGRSHLHHITYFTWFQDQLITVPNFPAWICDFCGRRDYDSRAISMLNTLLSSQKKAAGDRAAAAQ